MIVSLGLFAFLCILALSLATGSCKTRTWRDWFTVTMAAFVVLIVLLRIAAM